MGFKEGFIKKPQAAVFESDFLDAIGAGFFYARRLDREG